MAVFVSALPTNLSGNGIEADSPRSGFSGSAGYPFGALVMFPTLRFTSSDNAGFVLAFAYMLASVFSSFAPVILVVVAAGTSTSERRATAAFGHRSVSTAACRSGLAGR
jgi:hypothetical protein